jgi:hypothetical protein
MKSIDAGSWSGNWAWSLPLIVLNVVIHVIGLGLMWRIKDLLGASPCLKNCRTDLWAALSGGLLVQLPEGELPASNLQAGVIRGGC